jgi:hypothetical protein
MDAWLLLLFIVFISLVIADGFLTYVGVRRGHIERMSGTKQFIKKYGLGKAIVGTRLILVSLGTVFFLMDLIMPETHLLDTVILGILIIFLSYVVIQNCVQLLKGRIREKAM